MAMRNLVNWMDARYRRLRSLPVRLRFRQIPDVNLYLPHFSPWEGAGFDRYYDIASPRTLVTRDRCYVLMILLKQAVHLGGDVIECGVYRGGTAAMMATVLREAGATKKLYLFDTFAGMPETDSLLDTHLAGDFGDTSARDVEAFVNAPGVALLRPGLIPETFHGLESKRFCFAHIDLDIYKSIIDALDFVWPRLANGGFIVFDDYGFASCPGARSAVDKFFAGTTTRPLPLASGQAVVFKHAEFSA